jgi:hypothetical protein
MNAVAIPILSPEMTALIVGVLAIVLPVCQVLKSLLKLTGTGAIVLSFVISAVIGLPMGLAQHLPWIHVAVLVVFAFLGANGWYKVIAQKNGPTPPPEP